MKVFIAGIATESNTFVNSTTTLADFQAFELFHGDATAHVDRAVYGRILARWRAAAEQHGDQVVEGLCAAAEAGGPVEAFAWHALRDELLADLDAVGSPDVVLLNLHGAMVALDCDDCEGDLLARVRARVGPRCIVAALLDLHCHLSAAMLRHADLLIAYKAYPHTDVFDRADELFALARRCSTQGLRPVTSVFDCRMLGSWPTTHEPMSSLVRAMQAREETPGVLSVSLGHGYPWADVPDVGAKAWAIAVADETLSERAARETGLAFYAARHAMESHAVDVLELDAVLAASQDGRLVMADLADNPGGGAPGDSTIVLKALLDAGAGPLVAGCLVDPEAVAACARAGIDAQLQIDIGGRSGAGQPLALRVTVRGLSEDHRQTGLLGEPESLGAAAWVRSGDCDIVLCSLRTQTYHPDAFTNLGLEFAQRGVILVKSAHHFEAAFAPLASRIVPVQSAGALADVRSLTYTQRDANYWPRVDDPLMVNA